MTRRTKAEKRADHKRAVEFLKKHLRPGDTVSTKVLHVSRSGMSRTIAVFIAIDGEVVNISRSVADAADHRWDDNRGGVGIGGVGMDMGFALVYNLSHSLWPGKVRCTGKVETCHSNDHVNGDRKYDGRRWHRDSGYALRRVWV